MASITFTIPDGAVQRVLDSTAYLNGYSDSIPDPINIGETIPNPVTKSSFVKSVIINMLKDNMKAYESSSAISTATQTLNDEITGISIS